MTGGFPLLGTLANPQDTGFGQISATSGAANTKGAWTQAFASTTYDVAGILVGAEVFKSGTNVVMGMDIGVGPAGSEVVIINNLVAFRNDSISGNKIIVHPHYFFPITIPAGSRIAVRGQSNGATTSCRATINLLDGDFVRADGAPIVDSIGFLTASSMGTAVTPGTASKGSYAQLIASTSVDYSAICMSIDNQAAAGGISYDIYFDIAIGAAGSEQIIFSNLCMLFAPNQTSIVALGNTSSPLIPLSIPAGSRIAVRAQADNAASAVGVTLYGVRQ